MRFRFDLTVTQKLCAAVIFATLLFPSVADGRPGGKLVPRSGALLGAYVNPDAANPWTRSEVTALESRLGRRIRIDLHYFAYNEKLPTRSLQWDVAGGRIPLVTWGGKLGPGAVDAINAGRYDALLRSQALGLKSLGAPVFLRPMWEMNGRWMPWNGVHTNDPGTTDGPSKFVRAWRRMHSIFQRAGATSVIWVWAPGHSDLPAYSWNHWTRYYPGDAYVDWVGIDGYNRGTMRNWGGWTSLASIISPIYADYAARKPIMVAETGSVEQGGSKAHWISSLGSALQSSFPSVAALLYWDSRKLNVKGSDFRLGTSASSMLAFVQLSRKSYFTH